MRNQRHVAITGDQVGDVAARGFPPVDLAAAQRRLRGKFVQRQKFDAFEMRHLGAGGEARRAAAAWLVLLEAREGGLSPADMLVVQEAERAAADHLPYRLGGGGRRPPFRPET